VGGRGADQRGCGNDGHESQKKKNIGREGGAVPQLPIYIRDQHLVPSIGETQHSDGKSCGPTGIDIVGKERRVRFKSKSLGGWGGLSRIGGR